MAGALAVYGVYLPFPHFYHSAVFLLQQITADADTLLLLKTSSYVYSAWQPFVRYEHLFYAARNWSLFFQSKDKLESAIKTLPHWFAPGSVKAPEANCPWLESWLILLMLGLILNI